MQASFLQSGIVSACLLAAPLQVYALGAPVTTDKALVSALEPGPVIITDVGPSFTVRMEPFSASIRSLKNATLQAERSRVGVSKHLILRDSTGQRIGIFRSQDVGGQIEAEIAVLDPINFFDLSPVVSVKLKQGKKKVEGYLQRFEISRPTAPSMGYSSFVQQIQKIGILDILLINEDRNIGNLVIKEGVLIPIDHNKTLLTDDGEHFGLDVAKRLSEPPFWHRVYPRAVHSPVWLATRQFLPWSQKPWTPQSEAFIQQWNVDQVIKELRGQFAVSEGALGALKAMDTWLKKSAAAQLTLEQAGAPIYNSKSIFQDIYHLVRYARFEDAMEYAGLEYDMLVAIELTRHQLRNSSGRVQTPSDIQNLFDSILNKLMDRRIALIQGKLSPQEKDEYMSEVWLNLFFEDELHQWLREHEDLPKEKLRMMGCRNARKHTPGELEEGAPLPCFVEVLELSNKLIASRMEKESGSVAAALREGLNHAFLVHFSYVSALLAAKPGTEDYLRMAQFLRLQIDRSNELLIPGVTWTSEQNIQMSKMPAADVVAVIALVRKKALEEAGYYHEKLGSAWLAFAAPKYIDDYLDRAQQLRRQVEAGQLDTAKFNEELSK